MAKHFVEIKKAPKEALERERTKFCANAQHIPLKTFGNMK
jgi:hypothetical protein